jgi:hypothetical protein
MKKSQNSNKNTINYNDEIKSKYSFKIAGYSDNIDMIIITLSNGSFLFYRYIYLTIHLIVYLFIYLFIYLYISLSLLYHDAYLSTYLSIYYSNNNNISSFSSRIHLAVRLNLSNNNNNNNIDKDNINHWNYINHDNIILDEIISKVLVMKDIYQSIHHKSNKSCIDATSGVENDNCSNIIAIINTKHLLNTNDNDTTLIRSDLLSLVKLKIQKKKKIIIPSNLYSNYEEKLTYDNSYTLMIELEDSVKISSSDYINRPRLGIYRSHYLSVYLSISLSIYVSNGSSGNE